MNDLSEAQKNIRKYLLGNLDDAVESRQIEQTILRDDTFAEQVSIAEDELIEEYLDNGLSLQESENFKQFFLVEPNRRQKLRLIENRRKSATETDTESLISKKKETKGFFSRFLSKAFLRFAIIFLIVAGIGFIICRTVFYKSDIDKGLAQMRSAYSGKRLLESRSTFDLGYAPFTVTRGENAVSTDSILLKRAEILLLDAAENPSDAQAHHALGLFYLNNKEFDKAAEEFDKALKISPEDAKLHNDLGAVFLEKAVQAESNEKYDETMENLAHSLQSLNRAIQLSGNLLEAIFNKALVFQKMRLPEQTRQTWQIYIEFDPKSQWSDEAKKNLETLIESADTPKDKSQILNDFLVAFHQKDDSKAFQIVSQTKELITGVMVQQQIAEKFLEAVIQNKPVEESEYLSAFEYLGNLEKQNTGDPFFEELAKYYSSAKPRQLQNLLLAHQKLDESYELILKFQFRKASETLTKSRKAFSDAGNRWEIYLTDYETAYCLTQLGQSEESNRLLLKSISEFDEKNYWLKALFYGWLGSNYSGAGEFSQAIEFDRKSLETAQKISDSYNVQRSLNQLANEYRRIGNLSETFNYCFRGLSNNDLYYLPPRQQFRNLYFFTQTSIEAGFYDAAAAFSRENLDLLNNHLKDNWIKHSVNVQLGTIYGKTGEYENAQREFESSLEIAKNFSDEVKVKQLSARSFLSMANMQRQKGDCAAAVENYEKTLSYYQTLEFSNNIYEAEKGKLLCYITQDDESSVKEKMPLILKSFDDYRQKLKESERTDFFNTEQSVYDAAIDFSYSQLKNSEEAFNYSENSRSRTLLGLMNGTDLSQTFSLSKIQEKMPGGVQIIYYTVLPDKFLIWHITKSKISTFEKAVSQEDLAKLVSEYRKNLTGRFDSVINENLSHQLYELLISPEKENLERDTAICFIADKDIFQVPFASLVSPETNKFLIEDYAVMLAPSATVFIEESENARQKNLHRNEMILSVGNPDFSKKEYPNLADLPSAKTEAEDVAEFYQTKLVYTENRAAKSQVTKGFEKADIVHYAGHYIPNFKSPSLSKFLLAADDSVQTPNDLSVKEIVENKLPITKLIVLSACETGIEKFYNGEGMIGAARAFLASDVPLVVASQWSVDSNATAELMKKFHSYRKRGNLKTVEALRRAQIEMLHDQKSRFQKPFYWSGFLPIGGFADY